MLTVVKDRPELKGYVTQLDRIRSLAEARARQLTGWSGAIEKLPFNGRRQLPQKERVSREMADKARDFGEKFLRSLKPEHPLYNSSEARAARRERVEE